MGRRGKGEGAIYQRHDHKTCPPADPDGERPAHKCRGRHTSVVDLGVVDGKRVRKTIYGKTRKEVSIKLGLAKEQQRQGVDLASKALTMGAWCDHFLDVICVERNLAAGSMESYARTIRRFIKPSLDKVRLDKVTADDCRAIYAKMRAEGAQESYIRNTHRIIGVILNAAVRERKIAYAVTSQISWGSAREEDESRSLEALSLDDARKVIRDGELRWYVAVFFGLRQGEALGLQWGDVDWDAGVLHIQRQWKRPAARTKQPRRYGKLKTRRSKRDIPLVAGSLARFRAAYDAAGQPGTHVPVFPGRYGDQPPRHATDNARWRAKLAELGIEHVTLHSARATAATLLDEAGVSPRLVMQILGQSSLDVTFGYQRPDVETLRRGMQAYGELVEPGDEPDQPEPPRLRLVR